MIKAKYLIITLTGILSLSISSCLKDEDVKLAYNGFQPLTIDDDWQVSTPAEEKMDEFFLNAAYQLIYSNERFGMARSLLVIRNGKIVAEAYPHDPDDASRIENISILH